MPVILFFSDTHLGLDEPVRPRSPRPRRGPDFFANFHRVLREARERRVAAVIHGGDLFFRSRVPQVIVDRVYADIHAFLDGGIPFLLLPGNHERSRLPTSLFLPHPLLHVFDQPRTVTLDLPGGRLAVGGFPSVRDDVRRSFAALVAETGLRETPADIRLLCLHQTIEGAHVGPGKFVFRDGPDVIPRALLPGGLDAVLAGHIHRHQVHTYADPGDGRPIPILFPGSTERTSFAERDETKGFLLLTLAPRSVDWDFVPLPARPMVILEPPPTLTAARFEAWLAACVTSVPARAIVRLQLPAALGPAFSLAKGRLPPDTLIEYRRSDDG